MKKFTVTYEFASYISEEIESADMDEACEKHAIKNITK